MGEAFSSSSRSPCDFRRAARRARSAAARTGDAAHVESADVHVAAEAVDVEVHHADSRRHRGEACISSRRRRLARHPSSSRARRRRSVPSPGAGGGFDRSPRSSAREGCASRGSGGARTRRSPRRCPRRPTRRARTARTEAWANPASRRGDGEGARTEGRGWVRRGSGGRRAGRGGARGSRWIEIGWERGGRGNRTARTWTLVVLKESWRGWPHAASSPPHADGQDACVAPDTSPRERCQCSPCTTTYLHKTLPEHVSLNPVAPVSSPRKTTSAVSIAASATAREGGTSRGCASHHRDARVLSRGTGAPDVCPARTESSTDPFPHRARTATRRASNEIDRRGSGYLVCEFTNRTDDR